jgi:hypothetical protein
MCRALHANNTALMLLNPETLNEACHEILQGLKGNEPGGSLAMDGKTSRGYTLAH